MEDALVLWFLLSQPLQRVYVLILVLMEDALVHNEYFLKPENLCVLILVLMEDALVLFKSETVCWKMVSLNPCFNGRCTRTFQV